MLYSSISKTNGIANNFKLLDQLDFVGIEVKSLHQRIKCLSTFKCLSLQRLKPQFFLLLS